jgi:hypothetical protein
MDKLNVVVHVYNPSTERHKYEDHKFKVSLGYIVRTYLKKPKGEEKKKRTLRDKPIKLGACL